MNMLLPKFSKKHKKFLKLSSMTSMAALLTACIEIFPEPASKTLIGTDGDDELEGGNGTDTFISSPGADKMDGIYEGLFFDRPDLVDYSGSNEGVTVFLDGTTGRGGHAEGDVLINMHDLIGSDFDDVLHGNEKSNTLNGGAGDDQLNGGGYPDILIGGPGADVLDGGTGDDAADYSTSESAVKVNLKTGAASGGDADGDTFASIEDLTGSNYDDELTGDDGRNVIKGGKGADKIDGADADDTVDYSGSASFVRVDLEAGTGLNGDAEGDTYISIERVQGSRHDDIIHGDNDGNTIRGGDGDDQLFGEGGNDAIYGDAGDDIIHGNGGNDRLDGRSGNDKVFGDAGDDLLVATAGDNDELDGGTGRDGVDLNAFKAEDISYSVFKNDNQIQITGDAFDGVKLITSIEYLDIFQLPEVDVKTIWDDLSAADQFQFNDEADFLTWLGNDAGYNYEGL